MTNEIDMFGDLPVETRNELSLCAERIRLRIKRAGDELIELGRELVYAKERVGHGDKDCTETNECSRKTWRQK